MQQETNRQIAEKLKSLASRLERNGDDYANPQLIDAITSLEVFAAPPQERNAGERPVGESQAEINVAVGSSNDLATVVGEIKSAQSPGRPLSEQFRNEVLNHDRTRCVASLVFEDLWNGFDGWKSSQFFWDVVIFVWRNAPDFFGEYDPDREIIEDSTRWTQRYFDEQRNYLRHNFCLKRLCHLVMVYKYLHGAEADAPKTTSRQAPSSARTIRVDEPQQLTKRSIFRRGKVFGLGLLILAAGVSTCLVMAHKGKESSAVEEPKKAEVAKASADTPTMVSASRKSPDHDAKAETVASVPKATTDLTAQSNKVVKQTIALQPLAPKANKIPIRRSKAAATQD